MLFHDKQVRSMKQKCRKQCWSTGFPSTSGARHMAGNWAPGGYPHWWKLDTPAHYIASNEITGVDTFNKNQPFCLKPSLSHAQITSVCIIVYYQCFGVWWPKKVNTNHTFGFHYLCTLTSVDFCRAWGYSTWNTCWTVGSQCKEHQLSLILLHWMVD